MADENMIRFRENRRSVDSIFLLCAVCRRENAGPLKTWRPYGTRRDSMLVFLLRMVAVVFFAIGGGYLLMLQEQYGLIEHTRKLITEDAADLRALTEQETPDEEGVRVKREIFQQDIDQLQRFQSQAYLFMAVTGGSWAIATLCFVFARKKARAKRKIATSANTAGNG